ncbi:hypothetical protein BX661DRAFT_221819 [Kickxella alabastrina]|uniref:uncharacterized protein n=1 Tax=Kickxella alabastrina TaxID=61397 RepID=UPI00221FC6D4|nr:uncharacterized protein BX661DRAFT_221819 [Kickxella alabastrina]KAI7834898.1 hypothetical protein BX661DRAFT_221819 [Kickxella alabastrina]KAJ1947932.1 hypothetical protein GGF37_000079 [Kickxella alabastrina]
MTSIFAVCATMRATIVIHHDQDYAGIVDTDTNIFETTESAKTFESAITLLHRRHILYSPYRAYSEAKPALLKIQAAELNAENKLLDSQAFEVVAVHATTKSTLAHTEDALVRQTTAHSATMSVLAETNCALFKLRFDHAIQSTSRFVTESKLSKMEDKNATLHATICNLQHGLAESKAACAQEAEARFAAETARAKAESKNATLRARADAHQTSPVSTEAFFIEALDLADAVAGKSLVCKSTHLAAVSALEVETTARAAVENKLTKALDFVEIFCAWFDFICAEVDTQHGKVDMAHAKINDLQTQLDRTVNKQQYTRDQLTMSIAMHSLIRRRLRASCAKKSATHCELDPACVPADDTGSPATSCAQIDAPCTMPDLLNSNADDQCCEFKATDTQANGKRKETDVRLNKAKDSVNISMHGNELAKTHADLVALEDKMDEQSSNNNSGEHTDSEFVSIIDSCKSQLIIESYILGQHNMNHFVANNESEINETSVAKDSLANESSNGDWF